MALQVAASTPCKCCAASRAAAGQGCAVCKVEHLRAWSQGRASLQGSSWGNWESKSGWQHLQGTRCMWPTLRQQVWIRSQVCSCTQEGQICAAKTCTSRCPKVMACRGTAGMGVLPNTCSAVCHSKAAYLHTHCQEAAGKQLRSALPRPPLVGQVHVSPQVHRRQPRRHLHIIQSNVGDE